MAGSQNVGEAADNPVAINATAMVDVIFCLCLFFMCSFHFKALEGKIETWLPKGSAVSMNTPADKTVLDEIRITLDWDTRLSATVRRVGNRPPAGDEELMKVVLSMVKTYRQLKSDSPPVVLDAARNVPWADVVHVMDLCKREKLDKIEFSAPPPSVAAKLPAKN